MRSIDNYEQYDIEIEPICGEDDDEMFDHSQTILEEALHDIDEYENRYTWTNYWTIQCWDEKTLHLLEGHLSAEGIEFTVR